MRADELDGRKQTAGHYRDLAETSEIAHAVYEGHYTVDMDHPLSTAEAESLLGRPGDVVIDPMVMQSLRVPNDIVVGARQLAAERGVKVSTLFREWLATGYAAATAAHAPVVEMQHVRDYLDELIRREQAA